jgi:hypothetical protein
MRNPFCRCCIGASIALSVVSAGAFALCGCSTTTSASRAAATYTPPAVCANTWDNATGTYSGGDSEILTVLPNPAPTGVVLQLADYAAIRNNVYTADQAQAVITEIESALDSATTYGALAVYVTAKLDGANAAAGTQLFVSTGLLGSFTQAAPITECDKAIIKRHLANQSAIINVLASAKK